MSDTNTAAEPKSLAFFDNGCSSVPTLSMVASIAEFISSTINTAASDPTRIARSTLMSVRINAAIEPTIKRTSSCWKARSDFVARVRPLNEFLSALVRSNGLKMLMR